MPSDKEHFIVIRILCKTANSGGFRMKVKIRVLFAIVLIFAALCGIALAEEFMWPVASGSVGSSISQHFSYSGHRGLDITGGGDILATKSGTVICVYDGCHNTDAATTKNYCSWGTCNPSDGYWYSQDYGVEVCNHGYGNGIVISNDDGTYACYAHLDVVYVDVDDYVVQGTQIGYMGSTGLSTGMHLHFEIGTGIYQNYSYFSCQGYQINSNPDSTYYLEPCIFEAAGYTLSVIVPYGGGTATASGSAFNTGDTVALSAVPAEGYQFNYWLSQSGGYFANSRAENTTYTMPDSNDTVEAVFIPIDYQIQATMNTGGTVTSPVSAHFGDTVVVSATPADGYYFAGWTSNDIDLGNAAMKAELSYTMPSHHVALHASFEPDPMAIREIIAPDSITIRVGESNFVGAAVEPDVLDASILTYELDDDRFFRIEEDHSIFCKYAEGTSSSNLIITAPSGVSKKVVLVAKTNITGYKIYIDGKTYKKGKPINVFRVGVPVPYRISYTLSNQYDPGYEVEAYGDNPAFELDTSAHTLTFRRAIGLDSANGLITFAFPPAGSRYDYGNLLVFDDSHSMYLPSQTRTIHNGAFYGSAAKFFFLPDTVEEIGDLVFPSGSFVFLNTKALDHYNFRDNDVWFVETGTEYNNRFAEQHEKYLVQNGTAVPGN